MKTNCLLPFLLIIPALTITSCSSPKPVLEKLTPAARQSTPNPVLYSSFWEAMENMDFADSGRQPLDSGRLEFADALKLIEAGNLPAAESKLKDVVAAAQDGQAKKNAARILQSLLFYQSKWSDLLEYGRDPGFGEIEDRVLAEAYSKVPAEIYTYPSKPAELPIELSNTGSPIIPVRVNGKPKEFWLDTGAGVSVLASDAAEDCGIRPASAQQEKTKTATSVEIGSRPAIISDLRIGEIRIQNHPAVIIRKEDLEFKVLGFIRILKIDGIIGWNAIQNMDVEVDYGRKQAIFRKPVLDETVQRNFFWIGYPVVTAHADNARILRFGLDTGANRSSLRTNIFRKITAVNVRSEKLKTGSAGGWDTREAKVLPAFAVDVSGYRVRFKDISTHPNDLATFIKLDGILGSDIAHDARIRLDIRNGRFILTK